MGRRASLVTVLAVLSSGGCSSTAPDPDPPPPPPPGQPISLSPIAGSWTGTVTELRTPNVYPVTIDLLTESVKGAIAGVITYDITVAGFPAKCEGDLLAIDASGASYRFAEYIRSGQCVQGGMVVLTHNAGAGTAAYEWFGPRGDKCCDALLRRPTED